MKDASQLFNLIEENVINVGREEEAKNFSLRSKLREGLVSIGYEVREAELLKGLPYIIQVSYDNGKNPINDFQKIAKNVGLEFKYRTGRGLY
nr:hypothetical protein [Candidatus Woesearchaeota archaeon]